MHNTLKKPEITLDELLQILQTFVHESQKIQCEKLPNDVLLKLSTIMDNSMCYLQMFKDCLPYVEQSQHIPSAQNFHYPN